MGLSQAFFLGNIDAITAAVKAGLGAPRQDPSVVEDFADFSLYLVPRDLDLLSQVIGAGPGGATESGCCRPLRTSLAPVLDAAEYGVLAVSDDWGRYIANSPDAPPEATAEAWASAMRRAHNVPGLRATNRYGAVRQRPAPRLHARLRSQPVNGAYLGAVIPAAADRGPTCRAYLHAGRRPGIHAWPY
ncbi:MAG: hypothetical protein ACJ8AI_26620 [Rhodopila sp.]